MPGEFRDFGIKGKVGTVTSDGLMIRFYRGRAVHFTLDLPKALDEPEAALLLAGIDVAGTPPKVRAQLAHRWVGTFNGIDFKDVAALKMDSSGTKYSTVQATVKESFMTVGILILARSSRAGTKRWSGGASSPPPSMPVSPGGRPYRRVRVTRRAVKFARTSLLQSQR